jgi:hypothetical protein
MASANHVEQARREGTVLGIPLGDLGWFASLLMGTAAGFVTFFLSTFLAIVGFMVYSVVEHVTPDYALTYKRIGFPIGMTVLVVSLSYLGALWTRRMAKKRQRVS